MAKRLKKRTTGAQKSRAMALSPELKRLLTEIDERFVRQTGVLTEEYQSRLSTVAKQVVHNSEMVATVMRDVEIIKEDVQFLKEGFKQTVDYDLVFRSRAPRARA